MIDTTPIRKDYLGNGTTAEYDYDFKIFEESDLLVKIRGADDAEVTLVLDVDYEVDGAGDEGGGSITLLNEEQAWLDDDGFLDDDVALAIVSNVPYEQQTSIANQDDFYPEVHEAAFDKATRQIQQIKNVLDRSLKVAETDYTKSLELPTAEDRASHFLAFDVDGNPIASSAAIDSADTVVTPFAETLLDDVNAAAARATLGIPEEVASVSAFIKTLLDDTTAAAARTTLGFAGAGGTVQDANIEALTINKSKLAYAATWLTYGVDSNDYIATSADEFIAMNVAAAAKTVTLQQANLLSMTGRLVYVQKTDSTVNAVSVVDAAGRTFNNGGATPTTIKIKRQYEVVGFFNNGGNWTVVSRFIPSVWTAFTPTGSWTANTTYTGFYRVNRDSVDLDVKVAVTGAPTSASLTVNLPTGFTIDTAKIVDTTAGVAGLPGAVSIRDSGTDNFNGFVRYNSTTSIAVFKDDGDGTNSAVTQAAPMTFASGDFVTIKVIGLPIVDWEG